ncbi:hypothetical protein [Ferrimicrobium sp.]|uniref:hypothetical protein n=1 Tax=Ferrimicrobium sp. TaxID=2926050 RepID=UPI00262A4522|nr:hypothetical protein [Ferrimicrobium sp.]
MTITGASDPSQGGIGAGVRSGDSTDLNISASTIAGNIGNYGGGVDLDGTGTVVDSTIEGNYGGYGGGIASYGVLTVLDSNISDNIGDDGGGIYSDGDSLQIGDATMISGNTAWFGGGIQSYSPFTLTDSTVSDNSAPYTENYAIGFGGGIYEANSSTILDSTISDNEAGEYGGGVDFAETNNGIPPTSTVLDSTIYGNTSSEVGGGVFNEQDLTIENSTISKNSAETKDYGGGLANDGDLTLAGDLLATAGGPPVGGECSSDTGATLNDDGYNVSDDSSCDLTNSTSYSASSSSQQSQVDSLAASSLSNNGGATQTLVFPTMTSSSLGEIPTSDEVAGAELCPQADQRGYLAPAQSASCYAGAYQAGYQSQFVFPQSLPATTTLGSTYPLSATTSSGSPVTFLPTPSSSGVCTVSNSDEATMTGTGTCTIEAYHPASSTGSTYEAAVEPLVASVTASAPNPPSVSPNGSSGSQPITPSVQPKSQPSTSPTSQLPTPFGLITANGGIFTHEVSSISSKTGSGASDIVGGAASGTNGYWLVTKSGTVESFGTAHSYGSVTNPVGSVIGMAATPDDNGYWVVTNAGVIYNFGDAMRFVGVSIYGITGLTGTHPLNAPIVGLTPTPDGKGLYLVAADGGVFNFGDAKFLGNTYTLGITGLTGTHPLNAPIVGMTLTPDANGYLLFGADGGVFNLGDAKFLGNTYTLGITGLKGTHPLNAPIVGGTYVPGSQAGYYLFGADGGVFNFGTAPFEGSNANTHLGAPVIGGITL